ncbi:Fpg/Nei family DNA glycosylase [Candidatus Bipolaricaulota bacterium]|nr:Fpg/Nei family DNA glycosylase [Candidatus Bipolaricaulota bacterium]
MPELPDLETLKEVLGRRIVNREIVAVRALRPGLLRTAAPPLEALIGQVFTGVARQGKHLILSVHQDLYLIAHLMLSGRFVLCKSATKETKATGFTITFSDGEDLRLIENGPVKLARVHVVSDPIEVEAIAATGAEPLSPLFTVEALSALVAGRRRQVKTLLTDQKMIAGIGSAYADEILFSAKLSPVRYVNTLTEDEVARLHAAIRTTLQNAIEEIRACIGDSLFTDEIRDFLQIYRHAGKPCPVCGERIREIRYASRRTRYCPTCQVGG